MAEDQQKLQQLSDEYQSLQTGASNPIAGYYLELCLARAGKGSDLAGQRLEI